MRKAFRAVALSVAAVAVPALARAQGVPRPHFGAQADLQLNKNSAFGVGARAELPLTSMLPAVPALSVQGAFDYFFSKNNLTEWELNVDAVYAFSVPGSPLKPYAGAGLNYLSWSYSSSAFGASSGSGGIGFVGGVQIKPVGMSIMPFAEARFSTQSSAAFTIAAGVIF